MDFDEMSSVIRARISAIPLENHDVAESESGQRTESIDDVSKSKPQASEQGPALDKKPTTPRTRSSRLPTPSPMDKPRPKSPSRSPTVPQLSNRKRQQKPKSMRERPKSRRTPRKKSPNRSLTSRKRPSPNHKINPRRRPRSRQTRFVWWRDSGVYHSISTRH